MKNPILYVILNGGLNMSPGKASAQAVHAAMMLGCSHRDSFLEDYRRTVVVLEAKGREQLDGIVDYLTDAEIYFETYTDEGRNEVDAFSMTAIAVEPFDSNDERKREIFEALPLFGKVYDYEDGYVNTCNEAPNPLGQLQAENRELRRLWQQNEGQLIEQKVRMDKYLRSNWFKRLFHREKKVKPFVS